MRTVSSNEIYGTNDSQGARANYSGSMNEIVVNEELRALDLFPAKRKYESMWSGDSRLSEVDCDLQTLGITAEYKNQDVSGTADQKGGTELYNAGQTISCLDYVLVFSGKHWKRGRGDRLFKMYKKMAHDMNQHPDTFCIAAQKLHVMKKDEFVRFVELKKKERLTNHG